MLNGKIARKVLEFFKKTEIKKQPFEELGLTKREKEILELLTTGLTYKQIAVKCNISVDTMYTHVKKIFSKLKVHSRAEITARLI